MRITEILIQFILLAAAAPLLSGAIRALKNNIRMRKGAPAIQPYFNLSKLMSKDEVISSHTSYIFRIAPYIIFAAYTAALFFLPPVLDGKSGTGPLLFLVFLFALGRFFTALAGLDAASSFGGMGSSREMFISGLIEPVAAVCIFSAGLSGGAVFKASSILGGLAFFFVVIAETSRIPVDNQETHLELTMVHEAMVLEYSGRSLALIELAGYFKQIVLFAILANVFFTFNMNTAPALSILIFIVKLAVIGSIIAVLEVTIAKMRLFKITNYVKIALFTGFAALILAAFGV